jgi:hypothetical protein
LAHLERGRSIFLCNQGALALHTSRFALTLTAYPGKI